MKLWQIAPTFHRAYPRLSPELSHSLSLDNPWTLPDPIPRYGYPDLSTCFPQKFPALLPLFCPMVDFEQTSHLVAGLAVTSARRFPREDRLLWTHW